MIKYALLAGAMTIAAPALAQTATTQPQAQPGRTPLPATDATTADGQATSTVAAQAAQPMDSTTPAEQTAQQAPNDQATPQTAPVQSAPVQSAQGDASQAQSATTPATPSGTTATASSQPADAGAQAANGGTQVASIVDTEFPSYDGNKDGQLTKVEFDTWMVKLKQASDPSTTAASPATRKWLGAAFTQADKDRNKEISKTELIGFLSQGKS